MNDSIEEEMKSNFDKNNLNSKEISNNTDCNKIIEKKQFILNEKDHFKKDIDTIKYGDIIYLKHSNEINYNNKNIINSLNFKGVLLGDGLSNNKIFCSDLNIIEKFSVSKCLFKIEIGLNQYLKNYFKSKGKNEETLNKEINNYNDEKLKSIGKSIVYGDTIILKHIYSECYLTLEPEQLAKQIGCVQIILNEEYNHNSNFKILPSNKLKRIGDQVNYSDLIIIYSESDKHFQLHCNEILNQKNKEIILEVNAGETFSEWKPKLFSNFKNQLTEQNLNIMKSTDSFKLYNKDLGGYLSVSKRNIEEIIKKGEYITTNYSSLNKENDSLNFKMEYEKIDAKKVINHNLILEVTENPSFFCLWEIQRKEFFNNENIKYNYLVKIKNIATGLFLYLDNNSITLRKEINDENGYFYFKSKNNSTLNNVVIDFDILKIRTINDNLICLKNDNNSYTIDINKKGTNIMSLFQVQKCENYVVKNVNIICSLFPSLIKFYKFFQDWGNIKKNDLNSNKKNVYNCDQFNYEKTLENEWELEEEIEEIFQSFESLFDYLNENKYNNNDNDDVLELISKKNSYNYTFKQNLLLNQNILEMLVLILKLISNKVFESWINKKNKIISFFELKRKIFDKNSDELELELPQIIAKKLLNNTIEDIINILILSSKKNKIICNYLSTQFEFFMNLLEFYPKKIHLLLKEITKNLSEFDNKELYLKWINKFYYPDENILEKQLFYFSIIKNFLYENKKNKPVKLHQKQLLSKLKDLIKNKKFYISFGIKNNEVIIILGFNSREKFNEFKNKNKNIFYDNEEEIGNEIFELNNEFKIKDLNKNCDDKSINQYKDLLLEYIKLYLEILNQLCKGRFEDSISFCKESGLTNEFCLSVFKNKNINQLFINSIIEYYITCFYDINSIERISTYNNLSFDSKYIKEIDIQDQPCNWINNDFRNKDNDNNNNTENQNLRIKNENIAIEFIEDIIIKFQEKDENNNLKKLISFSVNLLLMLNTKLKFIHESFDFGYISFKNIKRIFNWIFKSFQIFKETKNYMKNFKELSKKIEYIIILKIYNNIIKILKVILIYKVKIQIILLLQLFSIMDVQKNEIGSAFPTILNILKFSKSKKKEENNNKKQKVNKLSKREYNKNDLMEKIKDLTNYDFFDELEHFENENVLKNKITKTESNIKTVNKDNIVLDFENELFSFLNLINKNKKKLLKIYSRSQDLNYILEMRNKYKSLKLLENNVINIVKKFKNQRLLLLEQLLEIEIIYNDKTLSLFIDKINNNYKIFKDILQLFLNNSNNNIKIEKDYKNNLKIITDFLKNDLVDVLKRSFENKNKLLKMQNMIRNYDIHKQIFSLLKLKNVNENKNIILLSIEFLYYFTIFNYKNSTIIVDIIDYLFNLLNYNIKISKVLKNLLNNNKRQKINEDIIYKCIRNINDLINQKIVKNVFENNEDIDYDNQDEIKVKLYSLFENLKILNYAIYDSSNDNNTFNQRIILGKLMKNYNILKLFEYKYFKDLKNSFLNLNNDINILGIKIYNWFINILADTAKNYKNNINLIKRILTLDQLMDIIKSPNYFYMNSFLKLIQYCYFYKDIEQEHILLNDENIYNLINFIHNNINYYYENLIGIVNNKNPELKDSLYSDIKEIQQNKTIYNKKNYKNNNNKIDTINYSQSNKLNEQYWKFLYNSKSFNSYGLLIFFYFLLQLINKNKNNVNDINIFDKLNKIKEKLIQILDDIISIEKLNDQLNFSKIILLISDILLIIPDKKIYEGGINYKIDGNVSEDNIDLNFNIDKANITHESIENDLINEEKLIKNDIISKNENKTIEDFIQNLKYQIYYKGLDLMNILNFCLFEITINPLDKLMKILELKNKNNLISILNKFNEIYLIENKITENKNEINLEDNFILSSNLINIFIKIEDKLAKIDLISKLHKNIQIKKIFSYLKKSNDINNDELNKNEIKDNKYQEFIELYGSYIEKKNTNEDIYSWIKRIIKFNDASKDNKKYIQKQQSIYGKNKYKNFLLNIFESILSRYINNDCPSDEMKENLIKYQNLLNESNVTLLCINLIAYDDNENIKNSSLVLLNLLLKDGNNYVQETIFNILNNSSITINFFKYIKLKLDQFKNNLNNEFILKDKKKNLKFMNWDQILEKFTKSSTFDIISNILEFLQLLCENCYSKLQNFLRDQSFYLEQKNSIISINIINELSDFTSNLSLILVKNKHNIKITELLIKSWETIADFALGPCSENQKILINNNKFIEILNDCFDQEITNTRINKKSENHKNNQIKDLNTLKVENLHTINDYSIELFINGIQTFKSIIIDNNDLNSLNRLIDTLELDKLKKTLLDIFKNKIVNNLKNLRLGKVCTSTNCNVDYCKDLKISKIDFKLLEVAFEIFLIFKILERKLGIDIISRYEKNNFTEIDEKYYKELLVYLSQFYATVEVERDDFEGENVLITVDFMIPFVCSFITKNIKIDLIWETNRNSDQERLKEFFLKVKQYELEMVQKQIFAKYHYINIFINNWEFLKDLAYLIVLIINIILIVSLSHSNDPKFIISTQALNSFSILNNLQKQGLPLYYFYFISNYLQLFLAVCVFIFCCAERYSTALYKNSYKDEFNNDLISKDRFTKKYSLTFNHLITQIKRVSYNFLNKNTFTKIIYTLKDYENFYNIIYIAFSIFIITNPIFYSLLLFDLVKRSEDLNNIIKSITQNSSQIGKTLLLGLFVMYFYAIIAFIYFPNLFDNSANSDFKNYCNTLLNCLFTVINNGLRAGGGIGEAIGQVEYSNSNYTIRYLYDLSFFVIVLIILLNIIFGIIIDTFGDLRNSKNEKENKVLNTCFICGSQKYQINLKGEDWDYHIKIKHNVYNYLYFIIYISHKEVTECSGVEKYIKEWVEKKDIKFLPIQKEE